MKCLDKSLLLKVDGTGEEAGQAGSPRCRDLHLQKRPFVLTNNMLLIKVAAIKSLI